MKKRTKKLLFTVGVGTGDATARRTKNFLFLFLKKKRLLSLPYATRLRSHDDPRSTVSTIAKVMMMRSETVL